MNNEPTLFDGTLQTDTVICLKYRSTSLFHFKRLDATNKAAITLPMPTPYAFRTALLAVSDDPERTFKHVNEKKISIFPPKQVVINPTWARILDLKRSEFRAQWNNPEATAEYQTTMSLREYAYIPSDGTSDLCIYIDSLEGIEDLPARINYFGKRGSFVQYVGQELVALPSLPDGGFAFELEDYSAKATWEAVNVYKDKKEPRETFIQYAQPSMVVRGVEYVMYQF